MSKLLEAYLSREEKKAEDAYSHAHPPKRSPRQLSSGQNAWLSKQPRDLADHIRHLLFTDHYYGLEYQKENRTYVLTVLRNSNT